MGRARSAIVGMCVAGALGVGAAPAAADEALATVTAQTPVVSEGSTVAWLTQPAGGSRAARVVAYRVGRGPAVTTAVRAGDDLGAGRDARGRVTLTWSACHPGARRCGVFALRPGQRRSRRLARLPRSAQDLVPVLAGRRLVTARYAGGAGPYRSCGVPFVQRLGSKAPARRLRRGRCGAIVAMDADGPRLGVKLTDVDYPGDGTAQQIQVVRFDGGRARKVAFITSGETANALGGFGLHGRDVTYALPGGTDRRPMVARFSLRTGRARNVASVDRLAGGFASRGAGTAFLRTTIPLNAVQPTDEVCNAAVPCTVVAGDDPLRPRTLVRRLLLDVGQHSTAGSVSGRVERPRVGPRGTRRVTPAAGVPVRLFDTAGSDFTYTGVPDRATPTPLRGLTDAAGRFSIPLPATPAAAYVARTDDDRPAATGFVLEGNSGATAAALP